MEGYRLQVSGFRGLLAAACITGLVAGQASACDLKSMPLGKTVDEVVEKYTLEEVKASDDRAQATMRASKICDTLPPTAVMRFVFLKGTLARVAIQNNQGKGELLKLAKDAYGEGKFQGSSDPKHAGNFRLTWVDGNKPVAVYTSLGKDKGEVREYFAVESREYKDEIAAIADKEEGR